MESKLDEDKVETQGKPPTIMSLSDHLLFPQHTVQAAGLEANWPGLHLHILLEDAAVRR